MHLEFYPETDYFCHQYDMKGKDMTERIIKVIEEHHANGMTYSIVETLYEFGRHYVLLINGEPGFHSTDLNRVQRYMKSWMR